MNAVNSRSRDGSSQHERRVQYAALMMARSSLCNLELLKVMSPEELLVITALRTISDGEEWFPLSRNEFCSLLHNSVTHTAQGRIIKNLRARNYIDVKMDGYPSIRFLRLLLTNVMEDVFAKEGI